jgi:hypothetical protein
VILARFGGLSHDSNLRQDPAVQSVAAASDLPSDTARARPWKRRVVEFLLVGGVTPFLFPLAYLMRRALGLDSAELAVGFTMFYAAHVLNDPHFAVTYVLFYRRARERMFGDVFSRSQKVRYVLAGVGAPLVLAAWAASALAAKSAVSLGLMIQLMFFLVGWHYVKQGFGILTVLGARRGVRFDRHERVAILAHCFAGWAYAWASPADPGREVEEKGVVYTTIAHAPWLEHLTHVVFLATIATLVYVLVRKRLREGRLPIFAPLVGLLSSVWIWSIYSSVDPLVVYVIPALHSVQYLYIVWLLEGAKAREREAAPWFEMAARVRIGILVASSLGLGWLLFHGAPTALDDLFHSRRGRLTDMGATPYFAALYTFVNLHHYFMDAVIWRRENPETRYLARVHEPN